MSHLPEPDEANSLGTGFGFGQWLAPLSWPFENNHNVRAPRFFLLYLSRIQFPSSTTKFTLIILLKSFGLRQNSPRGNLGSETRLAVEKSCSFQRQDSKPFTTGQERVWIPRKPLYVVITFFGDHTGKSSLFFQL